MEEISRACESAGVPFKDGIQRDLNKRIADTLRRRRPNMRYWLTDAECVAIVKPSSFVVKRLKDSVTPDELPDDLHNAILTHPGNARYRRIAASWPGLSSERVAWTRSDLPLLAKLENKRHRPYVLEMKGEVEAVIGVKDTSTRRLRISNLPTHGRRRHYRQ